MLRSCSSSPALSSRSNFGADYFFFIINFTCLQRLEEILVTDISYSSSLVVQLAKGLEELQVGVAAPNDFFPHGLSTPAGTAQARDDVPDAARGF